MARDWAFEEKAVWEVEQLHQQLEVAMDNVAQDLARLIVGGGPHSDRAIHIWSTLYTIKDMLDHASVRGPPQNGQLGQQGQAQQPGQPQGCSQEDKKASF